LLLFVTIIVVVVVVEAKAEIVGPTVKYLTPGSTLKLICKVLRSTEATAYIFWYHDNRMINYDLDRGINVSSEADSHYSELTILHTTKNHSGNYTCVPSNSQPASVIVHIFKGLCKQESVEIVRGIIQNKHLFSKYSLALYFPGDVAAMYHEHRSGSSTMFLLNNRILSPLLLTAGISVIFMRKFLIVM
ncbi:CLUMA_CG016581, isoform A, partial [Clunio marinus]